jgi:hypothetical protein
MTQKQSNDIVDFFNKYVYGVPAAAQAISDAARDKDTGHAVISSGLLGLGAGLSGTRLYNAIQSMNKPKKTHMKFGPGAKTVDESEKFAGATADKMRALYTALTHQIGKNVNYLDKGMTTPAVLGAGMLGLYGGSTVMNSIDAAQRKEEQLDMVADAKKEYQRALMGKKHAAALDAAFDAYAEKQGTWTNALTTAGLNAALAPVRAVDGGMDAYLTAIAASGVLSGKMTYDWTRARSKDVALQKARKSRARIEGAAPLYIDPEQLASIKSLAD